MGNVTITELVDHYGADMQSVSDLLDMIAHIESAKTVDAISPNGVDRGAYQLQVGKDMGGYTRLEKAWKGIPKEVTPSWLSAAVTEARQNNRSLDALTLDLEQQNFLMAAYVLSDPTNGNLIQVLSEESDSNVRLNLMLDYWVNKHWAGPIDQRPAKKQSVIDNQLRHYKRDPDWISLMDNLSPEFNMNNGYM